MNRRSFLASMTVLPGAAGFAEVLAQSGQQITHVDTKSSGPLLKSGVVKADGIQKAQRLEREPMSNSTVRRNNSRRWLRGSLRSSRELSPIRRIVIPKKRS
jgi:hypothetical protein